MNTGIPPTPAELAAEAREVLRRAPLKTGRERFAELVRKGFINARGEVTRLIGGSAEPEPNYQNWVQPEDAPAAPKGRRLRRPQSGDGEGRTG
jgi:hypothetical protein